MNYDGLLHDIFDYVRFFFKEHANSNLLYHNYDHTVTVVTRVKEIASHYSLMPEDIFVLTAAAWFHDAGQLLSDGKGHEEISVSIMKSFFQTTNVDPLLIRPIEQCILATSLPQKPVSFLDEIICDADTYNLGTKEFLRTDALLKSENELRGLPVENWDENTIIFLQQHHYFTTYCQGLLGKGKEDNIEFVRQRILLSHK